MTSRVGYWIGAGLIVAAAAGAILWGVLSFTAIEDTVDDFVRASAPLSGLARKFAHVSAAGHAASDWVSVLASSLWRSSRVNFHWKGAAICS